MYVATVGCAGRETSTADGGTSRGRMEYAGSDVSDFRPFGGLVGTWNATAALLPGTRAMSTSESRRVPLRRQLPWPSVPGSPVPAKMRVERNPAADVCAFTLRTDQRCEAGSGPVPTMSAQVFAGDTDGERGRRRPLRHAVPAIGRGRRQNPSDPASAQASRPPSPPSRSHWTSHRARDVAVVARATAPQGRPMTTATHRRESITGGHICMARATSTALTRVHDTHL